MGYKGFTMIEILLSLSLITVITAFSLPIYQAFQTRIELDLATGTIVNSVRRAQTLAESGEGDSAWGIGVTSQTLTLFKGLTFAARDQVYDETYSIVSSITPSGLTETVFAKTTGLPSTTGTITLTTTNNDTKHININALGIPSY